MSEEAQELLDAAQKFKENNAVNRAGIGAVPESQAVFALVVAFVKGCSRIDAAIARSAPPRQPNPSWKGDNRI